MESHDSAHAFAGFMNEHSDIIASAGGRTIRTSHPFRRDYFYSMKESPAETGWTLAIFAAVILIGVTITVLTLGYLNIRSL